MEQEPTKGIWCFKWVSWSWLRCSQAMAPLWCLRKAKAGDPNQYTVSWVSKPHPLPQHPKICSSLKKKTPHHTSMTRIAQLSLSSWDTAVKCKISTETRPEHSQKMLRKWKKNVCKKNPHWIQNILSTQDSFITSEDCFCHTSPTDLIFGIFAQDKQSLKLNHA